MKKVVAFLLIATMALFMIACDKAEVKDSINENASKAGDVIGYIYDKAVE